MAPNKYCLSFLALTLSLVGLPGCAQLENTDSQTIGASVGAVACGTVGAVLTKNSSKLTRTLATAGAALGCGFIGSQIGSYLDAQDKQKMEDAAQAALATGKPQAWASPNSKTSGTATIIPSSTETRTDDGGKCRTVRNAVVLADGTERQEDLVACESAEGQWDVQDG